MTTLTVQLPDEIARELTVLEVSGETLNAFVVGAVEVWLRHRHTPQAPDASTRWEGALQDSDTTFVRQLIADNQALFEDLARR